MNVHNQAFAFYEGPSSLPLASGGSEVYKSGVLRFHDLGC
jgi:hypothetical protein